MNTLAVKTPPTSSHSTPRPSHLPSVLNTISSVVTAAALTALVAINTLPIISAQLSSPDPVEPLESSGKKLKPMDISFEETPKALAFTSFYYLATTVGFIYSVHLSMSEASVERCCCLFIAGALFIPTLFSMLGIDELHIALPTVP